MHRLVAALGLTVGIAFAQSTVPKVSDAYRHYCFDFNWVDRLDRSGKPLADYSKLSAEDHIRQLVEMKSNALMVFTMSISGYMFYDSKVGRRHPTLHYDYLKEMIRLGHAKGIAMELYVPTVWADWLIQQHPSWGMRTPSGELYTEAYGGYHPDPNSPAADWYVDVIRELIPAYGAEGLFADGLGLLRYGQSEYTVKKFKQDMGRDYPKSLAQDPDWRSTVRWEAAQVENYWKKLRAAVKQQDPRVEMTFNGPGPHLQAPFGSWVPVSPRLHSLTDYAFTEAGSTGEHVTFVRGAAFPKPFKVTFLNSSSILDPFDPDEIRARVGRTLAEGGEPYRYDRTSVDGDANRHFTQTWGVIFREVEEKEPYVKHAQPVKYVAIVASEATMLYRGRADQGNHGQDLASALRALDALHIQHDVVADWNISADVLKPYQLVILPNVACLSDRNVTALRDYVRQGGSLWATAESSLLDENGKPRQDFALADVLGIGLDEAPTNATMETGKKRPAFIMPRGSHPVLRSLPPTELIVPGDSVYARPASGAVIAPLIRDAGAVVPSPGKVSPHTAIHANSFGKGKALWVSNSLFAGTHHREAPGGTYWADQFIRNVVEYLAPNPSWRLKASQKIWAGMNYDAVNKRHIVHLVNWQTDMPVDVELEVTAAAGAGAKATLVWPRRQALTARAQGSGTVYAIPKVGPHLIVVLER